MKKLIFLIILGFVLPVIGLGAISKDINTKPIFSKILEDERIDTYKIPSFLVEFALVFSDDGKNILPLFKGSHSIRIAICENDTRNYKNSFTRICNNLALSSYIDLVNFIDNESKITVKALFKDKFVKELVVLILDRDSFVAVSINGKIDPKRIAESLAKLNRTKENNI